MLIQITKNGLPIIDTKTDISGGELCQFGMIRDRQPDTGWSELRWTNLEMNETQFFNDWTDENIPVGLKLLILEDLAFAFGSNTKIFNKKLYEFGLNSNFEFLNNVNETKEKIKQEIEKRKQIYYTNEASFEIGFYSAIKWFKEKLNS